MRGLTIAALAASLIALTGCESEKKTEAVVARPDPGIVSVVNTNDPNSAAQLKRGFHLIEGGAWRWTMRNFAVELGVPLGAAQRGGTLEFKFAIPDVITKQLGDITIDAKVNGADLGPQTFTKSGPAVYTREVPPGALAGEKATFEFSVDKGLPPSAQDARELSIIASSISLTSK